MDTLTREVFNAKYRDQVPPGAKAVIIAQLHKDQSDTMTDYFAHSVEKTIILGFSKHTRDLFAEMRKFAALAPETEHLAGERWDVRVCIGTDKHTGGSPYYHKGQRSPWHHSETPEQPFTCEADARAWADAYPLPPMNCDGVEMSFYWDISKRDFEHREKYSMGGGYYLMDGWRHGSGWVVCKRSLRADDPIRDVPIGRWIGAATAPSPKPAASSAAPATVAATSARIEEHTHTKGRFQMFIVVLPHRVTAEAFADLLDTARAAGGWYSRKWGTTPAGFAFKVRETAEAFAAGITAPPDPESAPARSHAAEVEPAAPSLAGRAAKFRQQADGMQAAIDDKLRDRLSNTPKRMAQANHARLEGQRLQRTQAALYAMADAIDAGALPAELANVKSKSEVQDLLRTYTEQVPNGFHSYRVDTGRPAVDSADARALWALLEGAYTRDEKAETLRRKLQGLQFSNIPGFFPTPAPVVEKAMQRARLNGTPLRILEPEGGAGDIAVRLMEAGHEVDACEVNSTLRDVLDLRGVRLIGWDFLEVAPVAEYDRVIMNPPFENGQDIVHTLHGWEFVKPGGMLVSILAAGVKFRSDKRTAAFREWVEEHGGELEDIEAGAFKASGTSVATVMLTIHKD